MKLSDLTAKLTSTFKNRTARILATTALAGAALTAAAPAANAQRVVFRAGFGHPVYVAPRPVFVEPPHYFYGGPVYGYGYWDHFHRWHRRDWR